MYVYLHIIYHMQSYCLYAEEISHAKLQWFSSYNHQTESKPYEPRRNAAVTLLFIFLKKKKPEQTLYIIQISIIGRDVAQAVS